MEYRNFVFCKLYFFSLKFISSSYESITSSHVITESSIILAKYFPFSQLHVAGFQIYRFSHIWCFLYSHWHSLFFYHWSKLHFVPLGLHLHSHEICFINVFNSYIHIIMLKKLRFKSSVLFGIHTLLDKSFRVLQLLAQLSNITANG